MKPNIKYTLAFLIKDKKVLMIWRNKEPWIGYWNGIGGKIEKNETPKESIIREVLEETEIDVSHSDIQYKGIVTWTNFKDHTEKTPKIGMHTFVINLKSSFKTWTAAKNTKEGILSWIELEKTLSNKDKDIALNVPHFLKPMLKTKEEKEYYFVFKTDEDFRMTVI